MRGIVTPLGASAFVAFDASGVSGAVLARGVTGSVKLRALARAPLPRGALAPSPHEPNLVEREAVREAVARVAGGLGGRTGRVTLILPDGIARTVLLEPPRGVPPREFARYRLLPGLPFTAADAVVDVLRLEHGGLVAAVLRRQVVEEYEGVAAAAGLAHERVDLGPLAALAALERRSPPPSGIDVILGEVAWTLVARHRGGLRAFRNRRRDAGPGEAARVALEADRTIAASGNGVAPRLRLLGAGAAELAQELSLQGREAELALRRGDASSREAAELAWLAAALA
jgi:hypothetical protein